MTRSERNGMRVRRRRSEDRGEVFPKADSDTRVSTEKSASGSSGTINGVATISSTIVDDSEAVSGNSNWIFATGNDTAKHQ